jgi:hypothetical protein
MSRETLPRRETAQTNERVGAASPSWGYVETDVPAFEELQYISDIVRKTISNWDD